MICDRFSVMFAARMAMIILMLMSGCAPRTSSVIIPVPVFPPPEPPQIITGLERNFAGALHQLRGGREQEARSLLEQVVEAKGVEGITDEALFRLALLSLRDDGPQGVQRARLLIGQLHSEYPGSIWSYQSDPLLKILSELKTLREARKELRVLRDRNLSLSRDNKELRQSLERLKSLDLELEQKIRR